jgi:hypothetical protein
MKFKMDKIDLKFDAFLANYSCDMKLLMNSIGAPSDRIPFKPDNNDNMMTTTTTIISPSEIIENENRFDSINNDNNTKYDANSLFKFKNLVNSSVVYVETTANKNQTSTINTINNRNDADRDDDDFIETYYLDYQDELDDDYSDNYVNDFQSNNNDDIDENGDDMDEDVTFDPTQPQIKNKTESVINETTKQQKGRKKNKNDNKKPVGDKNQKMKKSKKFIGAIERKFSVGGTKLLNQVKAIKSSGHLHQHSQPENVVPPLAKSDSDTSVKSYLKDNKVKEYLTGMQMEEISGSINNNNESQLHSTLTPTQEDDSKPFSPQPSSDDTK